MQKNLVAAVLRLPSNKKNFFYYPSSLSFFSVSGKDSFDLINRLSTNNINIDQNVITQTIFTNENGRIIDLVSIWKIDEDNITLVCNTDNKKSLIDWIDKFTFEEEIEMIEVDNLGLIHIFNEDKIIKFSNPYSSSKTINKNNKEFGFFYSAKSTFYNKHESIDLLFDKNNLQAVKAFLIDEYFVELNDNKFLSFKIKNCIPYGSNEINPLFNPLELNLNHIIDFDKGCYIGQEVIARLDTYDKVQKKLISLNKKDSINITTSPGSVITSQNNDNCMIVARKKFLDN